jgi:hypothetical protein
MDRFRKKKYEGGINVKDKIFSLLMHSCLGEEKQDKVIKVLKSLL